VQIRTARGYNQQSTLRTASEQSGGMLQIKCGEPQYFSHCTQHPMTQPHTIAVAAHLVILIGVPLPLLVPPVNALSSLRLLRGICCLALIRLNWRPGYHRASVYTRNAICCDDMNSTHVRYNRNTVHAGSLWRRKRSAIPRTLEQRVRCCHNPAMAVAQSQTTYTQVSHSELTAPRTPRKTSDFCMSMACRAKMSSALM
jgi:hypothetical protein